MRRKWKLVADQDWKGLGCSSLPDDVFLALKRHDFVYEVEMKKLKGARVRRAKKKKPLLGTVR